jgi:adenine C2-methylase RlmN of 23S rRNA A2503 and tRNA A37
MLLGGVNDTPDDAERLKQLTYNIPCEIEILPFVPKNASQVPFHGNDARSAFRRPSVERSKAFLGSTNEEIVDGSCLPISQTAERIGA